MPGRPRDEGSDRGTVSLRDQIDRIIETGKVPSVFELRRMLAKLESFKNQDLEIVEEGLDKLLAAGLMDDDDRRAWFNREDGWINRFSADQIVRVRELVDEAYELFTDNENAWVKDSQGRQVILYEIIFRVVEDTVRGMCLVKILQGTNAEAAEILANTGYKPSRILPSKP